MIPRKPFPKWSQKPLEVSWATLGTILRRITNVDWNAFIEAFRNSGDIGSAAKAIFEKAKVNRQTQLLQRQLTIIEVRNSLDAIAATAGSGSKKKKERLGRTLLR